MLDQPHTSSTAIQQENLLQIYCTDFNTANNTFFQNVIIV